LCRIEFTKSIIGCTLNFEIMSYQVKENIVNIFSGLFISIIFAWEVYQRHQDGLVDLTSDYKTWGIIFLIFMGVSIVARIIIYIIFHIINAIATREDIEQPVSDEREKLIKLKGTRNSHYVFSITFVAAFVLLAFGMPVYGIFIAFLISGLLSEIVDNLSQIYYQNRGI
jgi:hypothetical protein